MNDTLSSLRKQLAEAEENLLLIQEQKAKFVLETDIPPQLIKQERRLQARIAELKEQLAQLTGAPRATTPVAQPDLTEQTELAQLAEICPYRSLEPFEAEHAEFYFGRVAMVERLVAKVEDRPFVAVVGPSGCGKSSLVRAGLVTALRNGALPGSQEWAVRFFRPGSDPLRSLSMPLAALLEAGANEVERITLFRELANSLRDEKFTLADIAARLREKRPNLPRLILVADQFEELYTECRDEALRRAFIRTLLSGTTERNLALVLTLRADFYGYVLDDRALGEAVDAGLLNVLPMSEDELRQAIEEPARKTDRAFEAGLVNRILEDVLGQPGNLPLLEFALAELWERQTAQGVLTHTAYEDIGGVSGAIAQRAETVYAELAAQGQGETVQRIFLRLTHYGEGTEGTRRRITEDDLVTRSAPRAAVERTVMTLADARLVVTGQEEASQTATVEVAHEALIRGWERLGRWLDQDRAFGLWRERLAMACQVWNETGHDEDALLRGAPLSEAEGWLGDRGDDLNQAECTFIEESLALRARRDAEREARREREAKQLRAWLLRLGVALMVAVLAIVAAGWFGIQATNNAQIARRERDAAEAAQATAVAEADVRATAQAETIVQRDAAERERDINAARELKARALVQMEANAECGLALALEAYDRATGIDDFSRYEFEDVVRKVLLQTRVQATLTGHESAVNSVAWSPDGRRLASASSDGAVRVWDALTGENTLTLTGHTGIVYTVAWSPDGGQLASGGVDLRLWDAATGESVGTLTGHSDEVRAVAYSPDGRLLASASDDTTVRLWDVRTGESVATLEGHSAAVLGVAWSPDGQRLASASFDGTVRLWDVSAALDTDVSAGAEVTTLAIGGGQVVSVAWSPNGQQVAAALVNGDIQIWDVDAEEVIVTLTGHQAAVWSVAWRPGGEWLASASEDGTIRVWDVASALNTALETAESIAVLSGHTDVVRSVAWSPNGQQLASAADDDTVRLWRMEPEESVAVWVVPADYVLDADWSPDGQWLASAEGLLDNQIRLWNTNTGESTSISTDHYGTIQRIAWSPDGDRLASAAADNTVHLYDTGSGDHLVTLSGHTDVVNGVTWSPDGRRLASASSDRTVRLWDADTGQNTAELTEHADIVNSVAWSPDGQRLASASSDTTVRLWDAHSGENTLTLAGHEGLVLSVAWSPDGGRLASGGGNGTIIIWDATTGRRIATLSGHTAAVWDLAWSPDGSQLASASADGTARLWDLSTGETIATLTGHSGAVRAVTWSPDGRRLATAGMLDHTLHIYYANFKQDVLPIARAQLERGSTQEERRACIGAP